MILGGTNEKVICFRMFSIKCDAYGNGMWSKQLYSGKHNR